MALPPLRGAGRGRKPVQIRLSGDPRAAGVCREVERAAIYAAMKEVREEGLSAAKHLDGDIWEVKADTADKFFRVLFAPEGRYGQVLLAL